MTSGLLSLQLLLSFITKQSQIKCIQEKDGIVVPE